MSRYPKIKTAEQEIQGVIKWAEIQGFANITGALRPALDQLLTQGRKQGIACALAELADAHMEPDLAAMVLQSLGLAVADLKAAGADPYDLERLNPKGR
jgi:hypothetical protein